MNFLKLRGHCTFLRPSQGSCGWDKIFLSVWYRFMRESSTQRSPLLSNNRNAALQQIVFSDQIHYSWRRWRARDGRRLRSIITSVRFVTRYVLSWWTCFFVAEDKVGQCCPDKTESYARLKSDGYTSTADRRRPEPKRVCPGVGHRVGRIIQGFHTTWALVGIVHLVQDRPREAVAVAAAPVQIFVGEGKPAKK
jgi:hypothetical protein